MKYPHPRFQKFGSSPLERRPAFQLLATCKTIYDERHTMFYSQNTFHLPPGPIVIASYWFDHLQPKHRALIRFVILTFTIADLTAQGFQHVTEDVWHWKRISEQKLLNQDRADQITTWIEASMGALRLIWQRKLHWLLQWRTLQTAEMRGGKYKIIVKGSHMATILSQTDYPDALPIFWRSCEGLARRELREQYEKCEMKVPDGHYKRRVLDVEPVKDWLHALGPGIHCRPWDWVMAGSVHGNSAKVRSHQKSWL